MKERVIGIAASLGRKVGFNGDNIIHVEGGLGSQILGLIRVLLDLHSKKECENARMRE